MEIFGYEIENVIPTLIIYIQLLLGLMWVLNMWTDKGMEIGIIKKIGIGILILPITYFIVNRLANED